MPFSGCDHAHEPDCAVKQAAEEGKRYMRSGTTIMLRCTVNYRKKEILKMENILAPSILSADFKILGEQIEQTEKAGAKYIHFDVMDGIFVPSISFGMPVLSALKSAR